MVLLYPLTGEAVKSNVSLISKFIILIFNYFLKLEGEWEAENTYGMFIVQWGFNNSAMVPVLPDKQGPLW